MNKDYLKYLKYKQKYIQLKNQTGGCFGTPNNDNVDHDFDDLDTKCKCDNCSICLESLNTSIVKTTCGHIFHTDCLIEWYKKKQTCPLCNNKLSTYYLNENNRWIIQDFTNIILNELEPLIHPNQYNSYIVPRESLEAPILRRNRRYPVANIEEYIRNS